VLCVHQYTCTCGHYSRFNRCKHLHLIDDPVNGIVDETSDTEFLTADEDEDIERTVTQTEVGSVAYYSSEVTLTATEIGTEETVTQTEVRDSTIDANDDERTVTLAEGLDNLDNVDVYFEEQDCVNSNEPEQIQTAVNAANFGFFHNQTASALVAMTNQLYKLNLLQPTSEDCQKLQSIMDKIGCKPNHVPSLPIVSRARKHEHQPQGYIPKPKRKRTVRWRVPKRIEEGQRSIIEDGLASDVGSDDWGYILHCDQDRIESILQLVSDDESQSFNQKWGQAKTIWTCHTCQTFDLQKFNSGYIGCPDCICWSHQSCAGVTSAEDIANYVCANCRNAKTSENQTEQNQHEEEVE
jgi:hypothetical protein